MKIEVLYSELCNLNGDLANMKYLQQSLPTAQFIYTSILDEPKFVKEKVDLIYLGPMSEPTQEVVLKKLELYKNKIKELIENGTTFLIVGNALDLFGNYIIEDNKKIECLKIFDFYAERYMNDRHNSLCLGKFQKINIVGFRSQFTQIYGDNSENYFVKVERGIGINKDSLYEGIHYKNFYGTYLLGPLLILNPLFTKHLLRNLGVKNPKLKFEKESMVAYKQRLKEFKDPNKKVL